MSKIKKFLEKSSIYNVLATESFFSEEFRTKISIISKIIIFTSGFAVIFFYATQDNPDFVRLQRVVESYKLMNRIVGLILFNLGVYIFSKLTNYYLSSTYYFEKITQNKYSKDELYTFSAGRILYAGRNTDILHGFMDSEIGKLILLRLDISSKDIRNFIKIQKINIEEDVPASETDVIKIRDIAKYLYSSIPEFTKFLNEKGITDKEFFGAIDWVIYEIETKEYNSQWWRPEILARTEGIADDWSYGKTFILDQYSRNLLNDAEVTSEAMSFANRESEVTQIENALSKEGGSNAILIGDPGQGKMQVIWSMCRDIKSGKATQTLLGKKPVLLSSNEIVTTCKDKDTLESQISKILVDSISAGNIILVIDNITSLFKHATSIGSDFVNIINPFLSETSIQIVALADTSEFHQILEPNKALMNQFETILVQPLSPEEITKIIGASALETERKYKIYFTYQAIKALADSASYYFSSGVSSDKALDLLNEITPWAKRQSIRLIEKDDVLEYISQKTNIPSSGKIDQKEKEKLLNLEKLISTRVIGQKDAVSAVSNSLRRARTGVRNPNKPIGSFLFLGPTGVGKTETAKALAYVFFGSEDNMMRLDMSEYQAEDAMDKLIGSFSSGKPGVFSNMMREKQYGVVLLDEFEKTNKDVLNLFLQILDEGFFSDMTGQRINTRNIIFIATSNAGAETIFKMVSEGRNPKDATEEIISGIVSKGLFKPELINRFDGTIIFRPLENADLQQVAKIMLSKVASRMVEKGLKINISNELIDYIVKNGTNKVFGARPMNRFIQDNVEGEIANLMLEGTAVAGKTVNFSVVSDKLIAKV